MNERIKKLMPKPWTWPFPDRELYTKEQFEKFAELIIEQCGIVGDNWVDNEDDGKNRISDKFKEHFGVK
jgi:hypothetical protein